MPIAGVCRPNAVAAGEALLDAVVSEMLAQGVNLPARQGLVPGDAVPWDGAQLVLNFMGLSRGQPLATESPQTAALSPYQTLIYYEFRVTLLREVAALSGKGNPSRLPSIERLSDDYEQVSADATALVVALDSIHLGYQLVGVGIPLAWGPVAPLGPEGALAGVVSPVHFQAGLNLDRGY
jgi:hypothetical protein